MDMDYEVGVLDAKDIHRAFAVIHRLLPDLDLAKWVRFTATASMRYDWLTVTDAQGYIRGLCHAFVQEDQAFGRRLEVPIFVSISLLDERGVANRLFDLAKSRARAEGCGKIRIWPGGSGDLDGLACFRKGASGKSGGAYDLYVGDSRSIN